MLVQQIGMDTCICAKADSYKTNLEAVALIFLQLNQLIVVNIFQ